MNVFLVGRVDGKRPLGKSRRRQKDNIEVDLQDVGWEDMSWFALALVGTGGERL
jgi:hypothetical protein